MEALEFIKHISKKKALYRREDGGYTIQKTKYCPPVVLTQDEEKLYKRYKNGAEARDYEFDLSTTTFQRLIHSDCFYCGINPKQKINNLEYNGIDRTNNGIGYNVENCLACCGICNKMKGTMSRSEFEAHIKRLIKLLSPEFEAIEQKDWAKVMTLHDNRTTKAGQVTAALHVKNNPLEVSDNQ